MLERINLIIKTKNLSASQFADMVGVQRSSVSHVLSGRNKPSLEFIQKVLKKFPDILSEWLLFGKGSMSNNADLFSSIKDNTEKEKDVSFNMDKRGGDHLKNPVKEKTEVVEKPKQSVLNSEVSCKTRKVIKVVLFYNDDSFKEFNPQSSD